MGYRVAERFEFFIGGFKLGRALSDAALQLLIEPLDFLFGADPLGDIGADHHDSRPLVKNQIVARDLRIDDTAVLFPMALMPADDRALIRGRDGGGRSRCVLRRCEIGDLQA